MPAAKVTIEIRDSTNSVEGVLEIGSDLSFPLSLTKSIASLNSLSKRGGVFSKTFKIPATKANNKLLVNLYSANQRNVKAMKQKKDALILVDDVIIERGYIKILDSLTGKRPEKYTLKFFGDNLDWVTQLGELNLDDITFNNDTQTYSKSNIEASWTGTYDGGNDHVYPWINYGQYRNGLGVTVEDMKPALRWRAIIERALNQIGYKLVSDFMDTDNFKQLIFPHVGDGFKHTTTNRDAKAVRAQSVGKTQTFLISNSQLQLIMDIDDAGNNFDNGNNYDKTTGIYTIPEAGMYNFKFNFTINTNANSNDTPIGIKRFVNGIQDTPDFVVNQFTYPKDENLVFIFSPFGLRDNSTGFPISLDSDGNTIPVTNIERETGFQRYVAGDTVEFKYLQVFSLLNSFYLDDTSWMKVEMGEEVLQNSTYQLNVVTKKDLPVLDLFNDLTKCFNLYWRTDTKTKQVFVEPRDTFYKSISDALNWSDKLDIKITPKLMFITEAYKRKLHFKYIEDSNDEYVKVRNEELQNKLGSYIHSFPDRFIKGKQAFSTEQLSPTYWIKDENAINTPNIDLAAVTSRMWNEILPNLSPPPAFYDYNPRILNFKYGRQKGENNQDLVWKWHTTINATMPYAIMSSVFSGNVSAAYNLSFNGSNGLFETYYGRSIKLIEDGIRLEAFFHLKSTDVRLDLRTPIYISKPDELYGYWIIDKIHDWSPVKDGTTRVTLIKLINYDPVAADAGQTPDDPEKIPIDKGGAIGGIGTTETDTAANEGRSSIVGANGTKNMAAKGSGSIAFGQGCVAPGKDQSIMGRYPAKSSDDIYSIGAGQDGNNRLTAFKIDKDGNPQFYGGEIQIVDSDGKIVPLFITGADNKIKKIYLKD